MKNTIILMVDGNGIEIHAELTQDTFEVKDHLKEQGYEFSRDFEPNTGCWSKRVIIANREQLIELQTKGGRKAVADKVVEAKAIFDQIIAECPLPLTEKGNASALVDAVIIANAN